MTDLYKAPLHTTSGSLTHTTHRMTQYSGDVVYYLYAPVRENNMFVNMVNVFFSHIKNVHCTYITFNTCPTWLVINGFMDLSVLMRATKLSWPFFLPL